MRHQRVLVNKRLSAELALVTVRLITGLMTLYVPGQQVAVGKAFGANGTTVLPRAVAHVHVATQLGVGEEALATELAVPGVALKMPALMRGQLRCLDKGPTANIADEVALARVDSPVDGQCAAALEGFVAEVAAVGPGVAMGHEVAVVQVLSLELLRAE